MKETIRFALSIASSNSWKIQSLDVKTAFRQSFNITRDVLIRPPPEADTTMVWKLKKPVYGLSDSSRLWYLTIRKKLKSLGMEVSPHDQGLFYQHTNQKLAAIIIVFVDDLLTAGAPAIIKEIIKNIKDMFIIGAESTESFRYLGMNITQQEDLTINLEQKAYIETIKPIPVDTVINKNKNEEAPNQLKKKLRSLIGKLNWVTSISRPDIAYDTRVLSTRINSAKLQDIYRANKVVKHLNSEEMVLKFPKFPNTRELKLLVFADASFANLTNGSSQAGFIILLSDQESCSPLIWNSFRIRRIVKSTLAAETLSVSEALDSAHLFSRTYGEVIHNKPDATIPIICFTDSKSLYKASQTTHLIQEKRLLIEISSIRQMIENSEIKLQWIESKLQIANSLTKSGASPRLLQHILSTGRLTEEIINTIKQ